VVLRDKNNKWPATIVSLDEVMWLLHGSLARLFKLERVAQSYKGQPVPNWAGIDHGTLSSSQPKTQTSGGRNQITTNDPPLICSVCDRHDDLYLVFDDEVSISIAAAIIL
jgi:hypothetical protein